MPKTAEQAFMDEMKTAQPRGKGPALPVADTQAYLERTGATRDRRMQWFREARLGMIIHWGLYPET